jgi:deferrochelatase/peroxidase EfeB
VAKATQEELLLWIHSDDKDLCWETQYNFRTAVEDHMTVALTNYSTPASGSFYFAPSVETLEAMFG